MKIDAPTTLDVKNAMRDLAVVSGALPVARDVSTCDRKPGPAPEYIDCTLTTGLAAGTPPPGFAGAEQDFTSVSAGAFRSQPDLPEGVSLDSFTLEMFVSMGPSAEYDEVFWYFTDNSGYPFVEGHLFTGAGAQMVCNIDDGGGHEDHVKPALTTRSGRTHVAWQRTGSAVELFYNGVLVGSVARTTGVLDFSDPAAASLWLSLSAATPSPPNAVCGSVRLSGVARYSSGGFTPPTLLEADTDTLYFWPMDETDGDVATDSVHGGELVADAGTVCLWLPF